jgi:hypothetical protein
MSSPIIKPLFWIAGLICSSIDPGEIVDSIIIIVPFSQISK